MKSSWFTLIAASLLFISCNTNDYLPEYQKERVYDGYSTPIDTVSIKTYNVTLVDGKPEKGTLSNRVTKWYDANGYHSMTKSILYLAQHNRLTTEQITRDKNSLAVARDIIIEADGAEPVVTLARLRKRNNGVEEWMLRHYLDPKKYLEDASVVTFTDNSRITKKKQGDADSLSIVEIDTFDAKGRLFLKQPMQSEKELPFLETFYNNNSQIDSVVAKFYTNNDSRGELIRKYVETYKYEFADNGNQAKSYTYRNDSLIYIAEYEYGYRK